MARPCTRRRDWAFVAGFAALFIVFAWLAVATWVDPGGHWWIAVSFTAGGVAAAVNADRVVVAESSEGKAAMTDLGLRRR